MRVVHIATSDISLHHLLLDQMLYLRDRGHIVSGICAPGQWVAEVVAAGIPVIPVPFTRKVDPPRDVASAAALAASLFRLQPDLIHTHTPKATLLGQWISAVLRVPLRVHTIHGLYYPGHMRSGDRWRYTLLERAQMAPAHLIFSQNDEDIATCRREKICDLRRLRYLGNGIDVRKFNPGNRRSPDSRRLRQSLGISDTAILIGMVGRLVREKGYVEFFEAAERLAQRHYPVAFVVVGPTEVWKPDSVSEDDAARLAPTATVRFMGHRRDMLNVYGAIDILALPSHREGFPRAPMEAAATGIPVVATDIRGCRQTVVDGHTGYLVPVKRPDLLADALAELVADAALRESMGRQARALAEGRFDQIDVFARVADAYDELATGL